MSLSIYSLQHIIKESEVEEKSPRKRSNLCGFFLLISLIRIRMKVWCFCLIRLSVLCGCQQLTIIRARRSNHNLQNMTTQSGPAEECTNEERCIQTWLVFEWLSSPPPLFPEMQLRFGPHMVCLLGIIQSEHVCPTFFICN